MLDLIREIAQTLSHNKLRTALTGFAVAWGIFMLIVLLGMSRGVVNSFNDNMMSQGANSIQIWGGYTSMPWKGYREEREITLKEKDLNTIPSQNASFTKSTSSTIYGNRVIISTPHDYISTGYIGVYPSELKMHGNTISRGRFINQKDLDEHRKVIVLTEQNASILFADTTDIIGKKVNVLGLSFTVIGLYDTDWRDETYIPFTTATMIQENDGSIGAITVELKNVNTIDDGESAEQNLRGTLGRLHDFNPDDQSAVWMWNRFTQHMTMNDGLGILNAAVWLIGIFTMLSGIVGVSNIMFVSVRERTHEIGIRRAIGARPRNILVQIICESVSITTLFGYIGVVLGIMTTEGLAHAFSGSDFLTNPTVDISIALKVTAVLVVAGCIAGLAPAMKALKVKPVEALRTE